jgi:hypothetical protein
VLFKDRRLILRPGLGQLLKKHGIDPKLAPIPP